jgi:hypothetical protein
MDCSNLALVWHMQCNMQIMTDADFSPTTRFTSSAWPWSSAWSRHEAVTALMWPRVYGLGLGLEGPCLELGFDLEILPWLYHWFDLSGLGPHNSKSLLTNGLYHYMLPILTMIMRTMLVTENSCNIAVLNCSLRYKTTIDCIINLAFSSYNIDKYAAATEDVLNTNALLFELIQCRDGSCSLSNTNFHNDDITSMIDILCTC